MYVGQSVRAYVQEANLILLDSGYNSTKTFAIPAGINRITASANERYLLLTGTNQTVWINLDTNTATALVLANTANLAPGNAGVIYGLRGQVLVTIDPQTSVSSPLLSSISAFSLTDDGLYFLQKNDVDYSLITTSLAATTGAQQTLATHIPASAATAEILVTQNKNIILHSLTSRELYKVNTQLENIVTNVNAVVFDSRLSSLVYSANGELNWYDYNTNQSHLITRSGDMLTTSAIAPTVGYAFYTQNSKVVGLELDSRDRQNRYDLANVVDPQNLFWDEYTNTLVLRDKDSLKLLPVR